MTDKQEIPEWLTEMKEWAFFWMEGADEPEFTFFDRIYWAASEYEKALKGRKYRGI